jgi:hypothetical protein
VQRPLAFSVLSPSKAIVNARQLEVNRRILPAELDTALQLIRSRREGGRARASALACNV